MISSLTRRAVSVLEVLVVIAILVLLLALLLPVIQQLRLAAIDLKGKNQLRQMSLATHHFISAHDGALPFFMGSDRNSYPYSSPITDILPFAEHNTKYDIFSAILHQNTGEIFQHPADPSFLDGEVTGDSSFEANALVFISGANIQFCCPDGLSNTILWAEQYAKCGPAGFRSYETYPCHSYVLQGHVFYDTLRRHSFADRLCGDVYPLTTNGVSTPTHDGWAPLKEIFQVTPKIIDCYPGVPTAILPNGLSVAMADGSTRTLSPLIDVTTFWGLVTPAGAEVLADW
jgi:type II secretory pathway pseudopilin PulG